MVQKWNSYQQQRCGEGPGLRDCGWQVRLEFAVVHVIVIVITNQDSTSSRLLPGSSYSCPNAYGVALYEHKCKKIADAAVVAAAGQQPR
jgi:hypothetical protein